MGFVEDYTLLTGFALSIGAYCLLRWQYSEKVSSFLDDLKRILTSIWIPATLIALFLWQFYGFWPFVEHDEPKSTLEFVYLLAGNKLIFGTTTLVLTFFIVFAVLSIMNHIITDRWIISFGKDGVGIDKIKRKQDEVEEVAEKQLKSQNIVISNQTKDINKYKEQLADTSEAVKCLNEEMQRLAKENAELEKTLMRTKEAEGTKS